MQQERVDVVAEFGDNERDTLAHQPGNECYITAEAIELRNNHGTPRFPGLCQCCREFGPSVESIGTLAALDLDILGGNINSLGFRKALDSDFLGLDAQPALALTARGNGTAAELGV
jgi:hypothetical protein